MQKIVLASSNTGKIREFSQLLAPRGCEIITQAKFNIADADETGLTFIENALIKARHASQLSGLPAIADDSGIVIDALNGAPGIYSARYAGEHGNSVANMSKVLAELVNVPDVERTARFICCIVYLRSANDPLPIICQGILEGMIIHEPRGENGFGYDPIMFLPEFNCTVAQLSAEQKNNISHRAQAIGQLQKLL